MTHGMDSLNEYAEARASMYLNKATRTRRVDQLNSLLRETESVGGLALMGRTGRE